MISPNLQGWSPPTYTNDTIKSTTDVQPFSLRESTTPVQRINVISPPPDRKAIAYQALPTRNTITEIETFHEHCLSTELELDDREGMGAEYIGIVMFNAVHEEHIYWSSGMQPIFTHSA
jgi:hypothetical protein